jgi:putative protein-disulfide isomerase
MLHITYYTDPLCCWSWAFEPQWRRFRYEFAGAIEVKYCMGGLLPEWNSFNDAANHVTRPIQMGPVWMHAAQISGMPMQSRIWMENPPVSSCIAVKCATLQSPEAGERYLRLLREEIMLQGKNLAKQEVLNEVAERLSLSLPSIFNTAKFYADIDNGNGIEAFRLDMNEVRLHNINRFPTLVIRAPGASAVMVTGYRNYASLLAAIHRVAPDLKPTRDVYPAGEYISYWGDITTREIEELPVEGTT